MFLYIASAMLGYMSVVFYYFTRITKPDDDNFSLPTTWSENVSTSRYINLEKDIKRKLRIEGLLNYLGIPTQRYNAVDGSQAITQYADTLLTEQELGRKLSHFEILNSVSDKWNVVLEDTACLSSNRLLHYFNCIPSSAMLIHFGISPWTTLKLLLTFRIFRHSEKIWYIETPPPILHAYAITQEGARRWTHAIEHNFFDKPLHIHSQGIISVYVIHRASSWLDFFRILALKDMSYITNKANNI